MLIWMKTMKIYEAKVIRRSKNSKVLYEIRDHESGGCHFAGSGFKTLDLDNLTNSTVIIMQLAGRYCILGGGKMNCENYSEYRAGNLIIKYYNNGNLTVFPFVDGELGVSILNYTDNTIRLQYNSEISIPFQDLPPNYYVVESGEFITIELLLPTTSFSTLAKVPRETIRRWKIEKKLNPLKITSTGRAYYSQDQCSLAKELHDGQSKSIEIIKIFEKKLKELTPGEVVYVTWFKKMIPNYDNSKYSTLRDLLRKLISLNMLERVKKGYYCSPTKGD